MGVNLVTRVRSFAISTQTFTANDHDVQDGCVTPGSHKIMRFDFLSYNAGNSDLVIGSPASRPDLFVWSAGHGHYHLRDFNEFLLFNANGGLATIGYKQAFCAIDIERIGPNADPSRAARISTFRNATPTRASLRVGPTCTTVGCRASTSSSTTCPTATTPCNRRPTPNMSSAKIVLVTTPNGPVYGLPATP